ncbi:RIIa domain-containing protein 1 [Lingula anatina]|uniref:RIIa domain-containing protein 1 n=1 Tax=Lingula anatina TaxID=7574 RepID=A0A1S3HYU9_LINAN|nr:RIIa domain-containing protein 1 [Lingula anatina]|eukprot:XP_013390259.1 RIIa domain-containing protein 1 [Lingula anatina]
MADKPKHKPPEGMEPYDLGGQGDLGALSPEQQEKLNRFKIQTRLENEKYLRNHPEVECLLTGFLGDILRKRPNNVREFASSYFTDPDLPDKVVNQLEGRQAQMKQNKVLQKTLTQ